MKLIIVHYHLRPGGIRRVIELATSPLERYCFGKLDGVVLATGEDADPGWSAHFRQQLPGTPVEIFIDPSFRYFSEQTLSPKTIQDRISAALKKLLKDAERGKTLIWMHNPGIGRNLLLTREVTAACAARGLPLVMHHHDWWFDNRWRRWPEMRRGGFRTLEAVAQTIFVGGTRIHHVAINRSDSRQLQNYLSRQAGWLPNLIERGSLPSTARVLKAKSWLGTEAPIWFLPCRFLRRKNIPEALLLTRWLRPSALLVPTGGPSSAA